MTTVVAASPKTDITTLVTQPPAVLYLLSLWLSCVVKVNARDLLKPNPELFPTRPCKLA